MTGEGMPHRAIVSSRPSGWFRTIGGEPATVADGFANYAAAI
jgi:hypothetical protein